MLEIASTMLTKRVEKRKGKDIVELLTDAKEKK
jgi:hypothetical protein